jgi:ATP-dependent helicase/nuclease subunit A
MIYKETPFVVMREQDGEEILIQGVIDCYFSEGSRFVLLDYKSGRPLKASGESAEEALRRFAEGYRVQMDAYRDALEKIKRIRIDEVWLYSFSENLGFRLTSGTSAK